MQLLRWQTLHDYRTRLLIEETQHVKMSHMKLGKEPHAAREPRVGHPCNIPISLTEKLAPMKASTVKAYSRFSSVFKE